MPSVLHRWFDAQHQALTEGRDRARAWRQHRRDRALWTAMANSEWGDSDRVAALTRRVQRAIRNGADLHAPVPVGFGSASERSPIVWALSGQRWDLVAWLLEQGADPHAPGPSVRAWPLGLTARGALNRHHQGPVPAFANALLTVAHVKVAVGWSHTSTPRIEQEQAAMDRMLDAFLKRDADPHQPVAGSTALHQVVMVQPTLADWDVTFLRRLGVNAPDADGNTPLHGAIVGSTSTLTGVQRLLDAGADPYRSNHEGLSPLRRLADQTAQGELRPSALIAFIEANPDLNWNLPGSDGLTPLTRLARWNGVRSVDLDVYQHLVERLTDHQRALEDRVLRATLEATLDEAGPDHAPRSRGRARL